MPSLQAGAKQLPMVHVTGRGLPGQVHDVPVQVQVALLPEPLLQVQTVVLPVVVQVQVPQLFAQAPLTQSLGVLHPCRVAQAWQLGPPQSMSVSVPFLAPSWQFAIWQTPLVQGPLLQSLVLRHFWPGLQGLQELTRFCGPPQSTSVSRPFCTPSPPLGCAVVLHAGAWQVVGFPAVDALQTPSAQSACVTHTLPSLQRGQLGPPQSTSVSAPFLTLS